VWNDERERKEERLTGSEEWNKENDWNETALLPFECYRNAPLELDFLLAK
jgi:hypothetical protein